MDSLRGLSLRNRLGRLLHLHMLLVREDTGVEVWLEGVTLLTIVTESGLVDATHLH